MPEVLWLTVIIFIFYVDPCSGKSLFLITIYDLYFSTTTWLILHKYSQIAPPHKIDVFYLKNGIGRTKQWPISNELMTRQWTL